MLVEVCRSFLVFAHLLFFSGALALVVWGDFSILKEGLADTVLDALTRGVVILFLLLWLTGLSIVAIDTGFEINTILSSSKLVIKLICVMVLTLNGLVLHLLGLNILRRKDNPSHPQSLVLCTVGALSTTNWLLAGFIGSANFLAEHPLRTLVAAYIALLFVACFSAFMLSKLVQRRLNWNRARTAIAELGIEPELDAPSWPLSKKVRGHSLSQTFLPNNVAQHHATPNFSKYSN